MRDPSAATTFAKVRSYVTAATERKIAMIAAAMLQRTQPEEPAAPFAPQPLAGETITHTLSSKHGSNRDHHHNLSP